MIVIRAGNVNEAWMRAISALSGPDVGPPEPSRAGDVRVAHAPVATVYERPTERVLMDPVRDANPFFHLHEALWMLAGRDDAAWLDQFVSDFSARFAEADTISEFGPGPRMHGAYGRRWRSWFDNSEGDARQDQLDTVVELLRRDPRDRQAVIAMWDPEADLGVPGLRDRPCNTHAYLRVREVIGAQPGENEGKTGKWSYLDLTVCCRSNDAVFGCYGANAVHFSVLLEYLAARIGVGVGRYVQVSNNWHWYASSMPKVSLSSAAACAVEPYPGTRPLVTAPDLFDAELEHYLVRPTDDAVVYQNGFLSDTARPMWLAWAARRADPERALRYAESVAAPDWRRACVEWLRRRAR